MNRASLNGLIVTIVVEHCEYLATVALNLPALNLPALQISCTKNLMWIYSAFMETKATLFNR